VVGLFAGAEVGGEGIGRGEADRDAVGVVGEDLGGARVDDGAGGVDELAGGAVAVFEEVADLICRDRLEKDVVADRVGLEDLAGRRSSPPESGRIVLLWILC